MTATDVKQTSWHIFSARVDVQNVLAHAPVVGHIEL